MLPITTKTVGYAFLVSVIYVLLAITLGTLFAIATAGVLVVAAAAFDSPSRRSFYAWVIFLLAISAVDPLSTYDLVEQALSGANYVRLMLLACSAAVGLMPIAASLYSPRAPTFMNLPIRSYIIYLGFCTLTVLWSAAPLVTIAKSFEMILAFLIPFSVATNDLGKNDLRKLFFLTLWFLAINIMTVFIGFPFNPKAYLVYSTLTESYGLGGGYTPLAPNSVSRYGALMAIFALSQLTYLKGRRNWRVAPGTFAVMGVLAQIFSIGRTGIASFGVSVIVLYLRRSLFVAMLSLFGLFLFIIFYAQSFFEFFRRGQDAADLIGLSGRIDYWVSALNILKTSPLGGLGFGVGGKVALYNIGVRDVPGLHSGFFDVLAGCGLIGFALWLVPFLSWLFVSLRSIWRQSDIEVDIMALPLIAATVLSGGAGGWASPEMGLFVIMLLLQAKKPVKARDQQQVRMQGARKHALITMRKGVSVSAIKLSPK